MHITKPITIKEQGTYKLSIYTLINCQKTECKDLGDSVSIKIKKGIDGAYEEVFTMGSDKGRFTDIQWKNDEAYMDLDTAQYYVYNFFF